MTRVYEVSDVDLSGSIEATSAVSINNTRPGKLIAEGVEGRLSADIEFRFWHVETLLNQSADLLDRCLGNKRLADELWQSAARYDLDLDADTRAQTISDAEITDGADRFEVDNLIQTDHEIINKRLSDYGINGGDITPYTRRQIHSNTVISALMAGQGTSGADGGRAGVLRGEQSLAFADFDLETAKRAREIDALQKGVARDLLSRNLASAVRAKRRALGDPGKPFDYASKIEILVRLQIIPDLLDAYCRISAAQDGLKNIYGWSPSGEFPDALDSLVLDEEFVETLHAWTQRAIAWLVKFSHLDQGFTKIYSLRSLVGEARWSAGISQSFKFELPVQNFKEFRAVRLRGISAVAVSSVNADGLWAANFRPPSLSYVVDEGGDPESPRLLDQSNIPSCRIGRIETSKARRAPEMAGTVSLMNVGPVSATGLGSRSSWNCSISEVHSAGQQSQKLDDLLIELSLAGRPVIIPEISGDF